MSDTTVKQSRPLRVGAKLRAVERVLRGEPIEDVAGTIGAPVELVTKWHKSYCSAGKSALRFTNDPGEVPTIAGMQSIAQKAFPTRRLHGCSTAACFFCAQFYGKNDIIHLYNAGLPDVTLVDLDEEKLGIMREMYPPEWSAILGDAFETAERWAEEGRRFDLVICDPYSSLARTVAWDRAGLFTSIASRLWIALYTQSMFDELGAEPTPESAGPAIARKTGLPLNLVEVAKRSSHAGGVFWCVFAID